MTEEEYRDALWEKARILYRRMIQDPYPVPVIEPDNKGLYPPDILSDVQLEYWIETVEELQVIKRT